MTDIILTTLLTGAAGLLVHFGQAWFSRYINLLKKKRSLARIRQEKWYRPGRVIIRAISPGSGAVVCEDYYISQLDVGRVLLESMDGDHVIPMTCMEFEALHVVIDKSKLIDTAYP